MKHDAMPFDAAEAAEWVVVVAVVVVDGALVALAFSEEVAVVAVAVVAFVEVVVRGRAEAVAAALASVDEESVVIGALESVAVVVKLG